jgi:lipid A 3-O-deacylase
MRAIRRGATLAALLMSMAACVTARAQSPATPDAPLTEEVRVGVLAHDVRFAGGREPGQDINAELLFASPFPSDWASGLPTWLAWIAQPRPNLGGDLNTAGATDELYAGLDWTVPLSPRVLLGDDRLTLDLDFGGGANNGEIAPTVPDRKALGSNVLFRLAGEIGWHPTPRLGVFLLYEHYSNGGTARYNESLNDFGGRVGLRF